jgi:hypothetical protein
VIYFLVIEDASRVKHAVLDNLTPPELPPHSPAEIIVLM